MNEIHPLDRTGVRAAVMSETGVSPQVITNWKTRGVPIEYCATVARVSKGVVTRQELRPDDYWMIWPDLQAPDKIARAATKSVAKAAANV
jgi:DNA-binding transcriptional regulator YdaS (Cro superfamily)